MKVVNLTGFTVYIYMEPEANTAHSSANGIPLQPIEV